MTCIAQLRRPYTFSLVPHCPVITNRLLLVYLNGIHLLIFTWLHFFKFVHRVSLSFALAAGGEVVGVKVSTNMCVGWGGGSGPVELVTLSTDLLNNDKYHNSKGQEQDANSFLGQNIKEWLYKSHIINWVYCL